MEKKRHPFFLFSCQTISLFSSRFSTRPAKRTIQLIHAWSTYSYLGRALIDPKPHPRSSATRGYIFSSLYLPVSNLSCLLYLALSFSVFLSCCHSRGNAASTYARLASTFSSACAKRNDGPQATIKILMFYFFLFCRLSQSTKLHPRVLITSIAKTQRGKFSRVSSLLACTPTRCMP